MTELEVHRKVMRVSDEEIKEAILNNLEAVVLDPRGPPFGVLVGEGIEKLGIARIKVEKNWSCNGQGIDVTNVEVVYGPLDEEGRAKAEITTSVNYQKLWSIVVPGWEDMPADEEDREEVVEE